MTTGIWTLRSYGPDACLVNANHESPTERQTQCRRLSNQLTQNPVEGLLEITQAFGAILLEFKTAMTQSNYLELKTRINQLEEAKLPKTQNEEPAVIQVPTRYNGPDLKRVADYGQLTPDEVIALHSATLYSVEALGFSPGFPYIGPLDSRIACPRKKEPRTNVPKGSVAIGGHHTGIYSIASPGGWNLIGETNLDLFQTKDSLGPAEEETKRFLLSPGLSIQFVPIS